MWFIAEVNPGSLQTYSLCGFKQQGWHTSTKNQANYRVPKSSKAVNMFMAYQQNSGLEFQTYTPGPGFQGTLY